MTALPTVPDPYFFRVGTRYFLGVTFVRVQLRRRWRLGPLRWSTQEDVGMSTPEIMHARDDQETAVRLAGVLARRLALRLRRVDLGGLAGDHG